MHSIHIKRTFSSYGATIPQTIELRLAILQTLQQTHQVKQQTLTLVPDGGGDGGCEALTSYSNQSPDDGLFQATTSGIAATNSMTVANPSVLNDNSVPITRYKQKHQNYNCLINFCPTKTITDHAGFKCR